MQSAISGKAVHKPVHHKEGQIPSKGHEMPRRGIGLRRINTAHPYMKGGNTMASVTKFDRTAIVNQLRHIERQIRNSSNPDIDRDRSDDNYSMVPERGMSSYEYFLQRKAELYVYNRKDVVLMAGWVVTAPKELPEEQMEEFFSAVYDFLNSRYGEKNCIQAVVHKDESGSAHMHYCFIPVVEDKKHGGEKICCNDVLNRTELRNFHPALQKYLNDHGMEAKIMTGITKEQGGNRTVKELKQIDRPLEHERGFSRSRGWSGRQFSRSHTMEYSR